jgi:hypothetical protein
VGAFGIDPGQHRRRTAAGVNGTSRRVQPAPRL